MRYLFFILFMTSTAYSQSFSVGLASVKAWGQAPSTISASASYKYVSITAIHVLDTRWTDAGGNHYQGNFIGIFMHPVTFETRLFYIRPSAGLLNRKYPTDMGTHVNFSIETGLKVFESIYFSYTHMSNGFGLLHPHNIGLDTLNLSFRF